MAEVQEGRQEKGEGSNLAEKKDKLVKKHPSQRAFQLGSYALASITVFCVPGFLRFRSWAVENNVRVLDAQTAWWILPGFLVMLALKTALSSGFAQRRILNWLRPEDRVPKQAEPYQLKLIQLTKALRDSIVHFVIVIVTYWLFSGEYWFGWVVGGSGDHEEVFREFPSWPAHLSTKIEVFFMLQLGINIYLLLDLTIFSRKFTASQNYYEMLMHHIATVTAIIFSTLCNSSAVGTLIFFVHDLSDLFRAGCRVYCDSKWAKFRPALVFGVVFLGVWIYNRIIIFPYCLIYVLEKQAHSEAAAMSVISFEYWFLIILFVSLYILHVFWTYLLVLTTYKKILAIWKREKEEEKRQLKKQ